MTDIFVSRGRENLDKAKRLTEGASADIAGSPLAVAHSPGHYPMHGQATDLNPPCARASLVPISPQLVKRVVRISAFIGAFVSVAVAATAQQVGTCKEGQSSSYLDINGVKALLYNTTSLLYGNKGWDYEVPAGSGSNGLIVSSLWVGGLVDDKLGLSGADYGISELWPGPIDEDGNPPEDCSIYDRIYKISRYEVTEFDRTGEATRDILDWPWQLGAPVEDGDGDPDNYDLIAGDRPMIDGDQSLWWVMNDLGNTHQWQYGNPLGIEVQVTAFAVSSPDSDLHYTTFFRHKIINKSGKPIDSLYVGMYQESQLGGEDDEFVGADTTNRMVYFYGADDYDAGDDGYGDRPPALGITMVDGPQTEDGLFGLTSMIQHSHSGDENGHPWNQLGAYNYLKGRWPQGRPLTLGGSGWAYSGEPTPFMYPGRPPAFWSAENLYPSGEPSRNSPAFGWFVWGSGPYTLAPDSAHEFTTAFIWVQGKDRFDSVYRLIDDATPHVREAMRRGLPTFPHPVPSGMPTLTSPADHASSQPTNMTMRWDESKGASRYEIQIQSGDSLTLSEIVLARDSPLTGEGNEISFSVDLPKNSDFRWHVRPLNAAGYGPRSETRTFSTGAVELVGPGGLPIVPGGYEMAFVQIQGIGIDDACGPGAVSRFGCDEVGGNGVYISFNGQGDWMMYDKGRPGTESVIGAFAPNDFEIRVTEEGSYGYHPFNDGSGEAHWVPFEVWDIGPTGPHNVNDPSDDIQMIAGVFSDNGGVCEFAFGETYSSIGGRAWFDEATDRVSAYYPTTTYDQWREQITPIIESSQDSCAVSPETDTVAPLIDFDRGRPLQNLIFMMDPDSPNYRHEMIPVGNIIRFLTTKPEPPLQASPAPNALLTPPFTFSWQVASGIDSVRVQVMRVGESATTVVDEKVAGHRLTIEYLQEGLYFWRLSNGGDDWSNGWDFVVIPSTSAEDDGLGLPTALELKPAFPNPFADETTLNFGLPDQAKVAVRVYDLLGREVEEVENGTRSAGWHSTTWTAGTVRSGVYFVVVESNGMRRAQPIVIVR